MGKVIPIGNKHNSHYYYQPLTQKQIEWRKSLRVTERCAVCDAVLIDKAGRIRSKEPIWQYGSGPGGHSFGLLHRGCCYANEVPNAHNDPMVGKHPLVWGAWTADNVTLND